MTVHRYELGQIVRLKGRIGLPRNTPESFEIVGLMPPRDGTFQYRLRSEEERHERVALEDDIELAPSAPAQEADNSNEPGAHRPD